MLRPKDAPVPLPGDSNSCSANFIVATVHWTARSLKFEKEFDEISPTGGHRILSPITATVVLLIREFEAAWAAQKKRITVKVIRFFVEHRRFELLFRNLNRRDSTLWSSLVSVEKAADEISSTGGPRRLSLSNASHCLRSGVDSLYDPDKKQNHP